MYKRLTHNGRFGAMAAVSRRQFCGNLHVITPQQVQWKPPLRQAAGTLYVSRQAQWVMKPKEKGGKKR